MVNLPPPARNRLTRELQQLSTSPPPGVAAYVVDEADLSVLQAEITGPEGSPFENGVFLLSITIPARYPFEPPQCRFLKESAQILYHPNVDSAGRICLDTLKSPPAGSWSPAVSLPSLLLTIRTLLSVPNGDDPLDPEIAQVFRRDPEQWKREAMRRVNVSGTSVDSSTLHIQAENKSDINTSFQPNENESKHENIENVKNDVDSHNIGNKRGLLDKSVGKNNVNKDQSVDTSKLPSKKIKQDHN